MKYMKRTKQDFDDNVLEAQKKTYSVDNVGPGSTTVKWAYQTKVWKIPDICEFFFCMGLRSSLN